MTAESLIISFDLAEQAGLRRARSGDGYPPYDIERLRREDGSERLRITLAVAGFAEQELEVSTQNRQLVIIGRQTERDHGTYLFRGIATRQFQRVFALAEGMEVTGAALRCGLLQIEINCPLSAQRVRKINISTAE